MHTILAIWKPRGPTSHDVVDAIRRITGERRVGHAGTLDPMAEGVLVIGIGREATRQLKEIVGQEKEYIARIQLGATSTTDDAEGEIMPSPTFSPSQREGEHEGVGRSAIEHALPQFIGRIAQVPPAYSAVKVRGKPAHRRVRAGEDVQLAPRMVEIRTIELLEYTPPTPPLKEGGDGVVKLRIVCGPGTYIRSLARDLGERLGVGGYLTSLERTRVGTFTKMDALTLEEFRARWPHVANGH